MSECVRTDLKASKEVRTGTYLLKYGKSGKGGEELFDMKRDPKQYVNLAKHGDYQSTIAKFRKALQYKLTEVFDNDLGLSYD